MNYHELLETNADDSELSIVEYSSKNLIVSFAIDVLGGEKHIIRIPNPVHIDMPPTVMLGKAFFRGKELLPVDYEKTRNKGYEGDEEDWRVMKIIDDEENEFYVIFLGKESIMNCAAK